MGAPKNNEFWKARSSHGRKPIFAHPAELEDACSQYFQWVHDNPLWETKVFSYQGEITKTEVPKMRAMTIIGLCRFIGIRRSTWDEYRVKKGFSDIVAETEEQIRQQKFEGAAADLLNSNIIARDLGLVDRTSMDANVKGRVQTYLPDNGMTEPDEGS